MVASGHPTMIGAAQAASTGLIDAMTAGGASAIASRGDELPDHVAMESGND